jgi:acid phosphatase family membrane protein YuiD
MVATTHGIGLFLGYDSPLFALAVAITMIVIYDAAGVRRQAGMHAERINVLFEELLRGHIWDQKELREVLGHTPLEVAGGVLLGLVVATVNWLIWK